MFRIDCSCALHGKKAEAWLRLGWYGDKSSSYQMLSGDQRQLWTHRVKGASLKVTDGL